MRSKSRTFRLATLLALVPALVFAGSYDEANDGDMSNMPSAPSTLTIAAGANTVKGAGAAGDYDYIKFNIPAGHVLSSLVVTAYNSGGASSFIAIANGTSVPLNPPNPGTAVGLMGFLVFNAGKVGTDILDDMGVQTYQAGKDPSHFTPPLAAGNYTLWIQDTASNFTYTFTLNVTKLTDTQVPIFTPSGGSYSDEVEVALSSATNGAEIYYTTDGTTPVKNMGTTQLYTTPLILTTTTTVKAYALKAGNADSTVTTEVFTVTPTPPAPTLKVIGSKTLKVLKPAVKIKGTATNATSIKYKVGNGPLRPAMGTSSWVISTKLKLGRNVITIQAKGAGGTVSTKVIVTVLAPK